MSTHNFEWDESKHPRHGSGDSQGGEFAPKGGGGWENVGNRTLKVGDRVKVQSRMQGGGKKGEVVDTPSRGFVTVELDDGTSAYYHESDLMIRAKKQRMSDEDRRVTFSNRLDNVEIFAAGTHNGMTFEEKDLDAIVKSFADLGKASRVPLKLGHNDKQAMTDGAPALGWVESVWRAGNKVLANFTDIPTVVFEAIRKKLYKQVSIELLKDYSREGSSHPWVLDAVALLGADIPAVKGLRDLNTLMMARDIPGIRFAQAAAFTLASNIGDRAIMTDEEIKKLKEERDAALASAATEKAARLKFEQDAHKEKVAAHRTTVKDLLEQSVAEGRIFPRVRDRILNSARFKDDAEVLTAYSLDAVKQELKDEQRHDFKEKTTNQKGATSMASNGDTKDFSNMTNAQVLTFKTEAECLRVGGDVKNFDDLNAAQQRVLKDEPKLARAYFSNPRDSFAVEAA